jgi:ABC-type multidrug transport system fused ATPase/permease subunit
MLPILDPYRRIQKTFHFHRKFEVIGLILFGVVMSLFELFTATAIIPLILIIVDPQTAIRGRILGTLYRISNLHSTEHFAILLACVLLLIISLKAILSILTWKYEFNVLNRWRISLCTAFFDAIIKAKHEVVNKKGSSELINILSSTVPYIISNYFQNLISICQQFTLAVFFIIFSLAINFTATIISAAFGATLIALFVFIQRKKVRYLGDQTQKMNRQLVSVLQMSIFGLKETKIALKESYFTNRFHVLADKTAKLS